jgi:hypothetical protein
MNAVEHLKALCSLGLPPGSAMISLMPLLREIVPHHWMRFGILAHDAESFDGFPEAPGSVPYRPRNPSDEPRSALAWIGERRDEGIRANLHAFGRGPLEIPCRPSQDDGRWILDATIGEAGKSYATLELSRPRAARPFMSDEIKRLESLRPWLVQALRPKSLRSPGEADEERFGVVGLPVLSAQAIVTAGGDVVHQTGAAEPLLITLEASIRCGLALPPPIKMLVQRVLGLGDPRETARMQIQSPYGVHRLNAQRLFSSDASPQDVANNPNRCLIGLSIELHEHPIAHAARILRASGATPAQVEVGVKLALGRTKPQIANELRKKESSIVDLTKKLYATLGVHNSAELGARIWVSAMHERCVRSPPGQMGAPPPRPPSEALRRS